MIGEKDIEPVVEESFTKAAAPLGLMDAPYCRGVRYEERLLCHTIRNPAYLAPLDNPAMAVMETILYDAARAITPGRLADNMLIVTGFLPGFVHAVARQLHTTPERIEEGLYASIASLYARSRNRSLRQERAIIGRNVEMYAACMRDAARHLREGEELHSVQETLENAITERMRNMPAVISVDDLFSQN